MGWLDEYDAHTVGDERLDPSSPAAALHRLRRVADALPVSTDSATWVESAVNNVWRIGELFLRINFRGDRTRLHREAMLLESLPAEIPHIEVVDVGHGDGLEWMLSRAVGGQNLAKIADGLRPEEHRLAIVAFAQLLAALHDWSPPPHVAAALREKHHRLNVAKAVEIVATDLVPLPVERIDSLIAPLKTLPHVDHGLIDAAAARVRELATVVRADEFRHVIHGDAGSANVHVDGRQVVAVMDFEFARLAPPDLELISFVRGLDAQRITRGVAPPLLAWIAEGYPGLFAHDALEERLWLYGLAFALETVLFWPPPAPEHGALHPAHPLRAVRRLVDHPYVVAADLPHR